MERMARLYIYIYIYAPAKFKKFTKFKSVVARITTHLKQCHATKFCYCKLLLKKVDASSTCCNSCTLLQFATTKIACQELLRDNV